MIFLDHFIEFYNIWHVCCFFSKNLELNTSIFFSKDYVFCRVSKKNDFGESENLSKLI